jgi:hypothetical protein
MTGEAHWLDAALMIGGGAAIVLYLWWAARSTSSVLSERLNLTCPVTHTPVRASLTEDVRTQQFTDVKRCSGWRHFWRPCSKRCLAPLNDGSLGEEPLHMIHERRARPLAEPPMAPYRR